MMKKNICFNALFDYVYLYLEISKKIQDKFNITWYCARDREYKILLNNGIAEDKICKLHDQLQNNKFFHEIDESVFTAASIFSADRFLKNKNLEFKKRIIRTAQSNFLSFLKINNIELVFGEPVNAVDLAIVNICKTHGIKYIYPQSARIPSNYVIFENFDGKGRAIRNLSSAQERFDSTDNLKNKPEYFFLNNSGRVNENINYLSRNFFKIFNNKESSYIKYSKINKLLTLIKNPLKENLYKFFFKYQKKDFSNLDYVFFPLHVQPELSVDVLSPILNNQLEWIKILSKSIPYNFKLLVKPHSNFLSETDFRLLNECSSIDNVCLVHPEIDSHELISKSKIVFTISGTAAYEAFFMKIPAIVASDIYFNNLPNISRLKDIFSLPDLIKNILNNDYQKYDVLEEFNRLILPYLFYGNFADPFNFPNALNFENIEKLSNSFESLLRDD